MKSQQLWSLHRTKQSAFYNGNGGAWAPSLAEELLTVDGFQGREGQFSLKLWLLVGHPGSSGWPHTQEYMNSTDFVSVGYLKNKKFLKWSWKSGRWCWIWVALVGEEWTDQNTTCVRRIVSENKCHIIKNPCTTLAFPMSKSCSITYMICMDRFKAEVLGVT